MSFLIEVGPITLKVYPQLSYEEFKVVRQRMTYIVQGYQFTRKHKQYGWDGRKTFFYKNQTAPAGCVFLVKAILEKLLSYKVTVKHLIDYAPCGGPEIHGLELMEFQHRAVERALKYRRGIIQAPVRAGKTAIAAALIKNISHYPAWFITYGKDLVNQSRKDLQFHLQRQIGVFSECHYEPGEIIVSSYQALNRVLGSLREETPRMASAELKLRNDHIAEMLKLGRVFIFDECHHAMAPKSGKLMKSLNSAGYVIGLSGTPTPKNATMLEVAASIGSVIFRVQYETLIKHKRLSRPMIFMYQLPYEWFTTGLGDFDSVYVSNIVQNMYRNQFIADVVANLRKRGKTSFVMVRRLEHGPILRALIPGSIFVHGKIESDERTSLYTALQNKQVHCIISTVGKEGLNIPRLDAVINAEGLESNVTTVQKMRSLTAAEGKKYGIVVDFTDRGKFLNKHSKRRIKTYSAIGKIKLKIRKVPKNFYPMEGSRWLSSV